MVRLAATAGAAALLPLTCVAAAHCGDASGLGPLYWPAAAALCPAAAVVDIWLPVLTTLGFLPYLRYRRAVLDARRRIRWRCLVR